MYIFFFIFRFCAVRWTKLPISLTFERTLIYRIVSSLRLSTSMSIKLARYVQLIQPTASRNIQSRSL